MWWIFIGADPQCREWLAAHPTDFVIIAERRPRPTSVVLHSARCSILHDDSDSPHLDDVKMCGARDQLQDQFPRSQIQQCPECLPATNTDKPHGATSW